MFTYVRIMLLSKAKRWLKLNVLLEYINVSDCNIVLDYKLCTALLEYFNIISTKCESSV